MGSVVLLCAGVFLGFEQQPKQMLIQNTGSKQLIVHEKVEQETKQEIIKKEVVKKEAVKEEIKPLEGMIISIDPGHQEKGNSEQEPIGPESQKTKAKVSSGTCGVATQKNEYELNLEVGLKLKDALVARGAEVYMTREVHAIDISNKERAEMENEKNATLSIRIHADSYSDSTVEGYSILVPGDTYVDSDIVAMSYKWAECIENEFKKGLDSKSRGIIVRNDLTGFNWTTVPAILIEMGFMSNPEEDRKMSTEVFQNQLIESMCIAIETFKEMN